MYGSDVKSASNYLVILGYLSSSQVKENSSGHVIFNNDMVEATKAYEKEKGLIIDGQITKSTASSLSADASSYRALGSRELTVGMSGTDVAEMKNLLIEKYYITGAPLGRYESVSFNEDLLEKLKMFLDDFGLEWEGKVDSQIVRYLKKKYDD